MGRASASSGFCVGYLSMNPLKTVPVACVTQLLSAQSLSAAGNKKEGFAVIVIIIDIPNTAKLTMDPTVSMQTWKQHSLNLAL